MPTQRLSMRRIREVLRLRHQGLTERFIARMLGVSNGVVRGYVRRARLAGLSWPLPEGMDDEGPELLLFPAPTAASQSDRRPATGPRLALCGVTVLANVMASGAADLAGRLRSLGAN
jgi:hypothetical protein